MSRTRADSRRSDAGQSTVEFGLAMILVISFLLFFFQLSMIFAFGSYAHYATFMAARAYLSAGPNLQDQRSRARSVIVGMLKRSASMPNQDRLPTVAQGYQGGQNNDVTGVDIDPTPFDPKDIGKSWLRGVRYSFKSKLFLIPLGKTGPAPASGSASPGPNEIILRSESFLGREASDSECQADMKQKAQGQGGFFDNGC